MNSAKLQAVETEPTVAASFRGNGGNGIEKRLREVERGIDRLETKFDTELKHLATKAWVLGGVIGGMVIAVMVTLTVLKLFGASDPN